MIRRERTIFKVKGIMVIQKTLHICTVACEKGESLNQKDGGSLTQCCGTGINNFGSGQHD